jgi:predicted AlkP superfamily pyrophosphatase or phosphodiesterase
MKTYHRCLLCPLILAMLLSACLASPAPTNPTPLNPSTQSNTESPPIQAAPTSTATALSETPPPSETALLSEAATLSAATPSSTPRGSVIVIAWDGGRADLVYELMAEERLPHFSALAREGLRAEWLQTVDPSLTAPAHSTLASGDLPTLTGIVSNAFHNPNDNFYWYRRGFDQALDRSTPVWVSASRLGLKTATVFFPGASPAHIGQTADYTIGYGVRDAYSRRPTVPLAPASAWEGAPASYSPPLEGSYTIPKVARLYLLVIDSTDDGQRNYDQVLFAPESSARQAAAPALRVGEWGSLVLLPNLHAGMNILLQEISAREVTFYHTGVYYNTAAPRSLLEKLNASFGFFQPGGDSYALQHGWITEEDYLYLLERASRWMAEVASWVYTTYQPDLLFTWQENFDAAGHTFLLQDERQPGYSQERASQCREAYLRAALAADEALEVLLSEVDLASTTVLLISDHGVAPVHTSVYVNTVLEKAGLLVLDAKNYVVVEKSQALAVASGGAVHVYINLQDHEKNGIVPPEDYLPLQDQIVALLTELQDPTTGEPVFQRVLRQEELAPLGLAHPHAGDVFAQAYPGYNLDGYRGVPDVFRPAPLYGQHGYASDLPEMRALLIAAGAGIPQPASGEERVLAPLSILDLAPTVARLLGFSLPPSSSGAPVPGLLYP